MKKLLLGLTLISTLVSVPLTARADTSYICTRDRNSSVNLRTGPGTHHPKGLAEVGSGGQQVFQFFESRGFTVPSGEVVTVFESTRTRSGDLWHKVGTNQWVAWVRADFVCQRP